MAFHNPTKYISDYSPLDAHECVKKLILEGAVRDGKEIEQQCNGGIGNLSSLCQHSISFKRPGGSAVIPINTFILLSDGKSVYTGNNPIFSDVMSEVLNKDHYCSDVRFAGENGWITLKLPNFLPDKTISRAELLKIALRAAGISNIENYAGDCFSDVSKSNEFSPYICYAKAKGYVSGYPDGSFHPNEMISHEATLKIILRIFGLTVPSEGCYNRWSDPYYKVAQEVFPDITLTPVNYPYEGYPTRALTTHWIKKSFDARNKLPLWADSRNICDPLLGYPIGTRKTVISSHGTQGEMQEYQRGVIYEYSGKKVIVQGEIYQYYKTRSGSLHESYFGFPKGESQGYIPKTTFEYSKNDIYQEFEEGRIYNRPGEFTVPYVPMIREDICGLGPNYDELKKPEWKGIELFGGGFIFSIDLNLCEDSFAAGCHIIAVSMLDSYYGGFGHNAHNFDLSEYNTWLGQNSAYWVNQIGIGSQDLIWENADRNISMVQKIQLGNKFNQNDIKDNSSYTGSIKKILDTNVELQKLISAGRPVVLQIYYAGIRSSNHAFVISGKTDDDYIVQDEYFSKGKSFVRLYETFNNIYNSRKDSKKNIELTLVKLIDYK